jgi:hypothetical protein
MSLDTYANLKTSIANFLKRSDLTSIIPDFITLAETKIARDLLDKRKFKYVPRDMEGLDTGTLAEEIDLPDGYKATKSFKVIINDVEQPLDFVPPGYETDGLAYTLDGEKLKLLNLSGISADYEWKYLTSFDPLSDIVTSNWLLVAAPDIYLYGALVESAPYIKDDARLQTWGGKYAQGLEDYASAVMADRLSDGPLRMRARRGV